MIGAKEADALITIPEITQENFRILLPFKIATLTEISANENGTSQKEELLKFYQSPLYRQLEIEKTKYWWESGAQLYWEYTEKF